MHDRSNGKGLPEVDKPVRWDYVEPEPPAEFLWDTEHIPAKVKKAFARRLGDKKAALCENNRDTIGHKRKRPWKEDDDESPDGQTLNISPKGPEPIKAAPIKSPHSDTGGKDSAPKTAPPISNGKPLTDLRAHALAGLLPASEVQERLQSLQAEKHEIFARLKKLQESR
ncbi:hypothetical protein BC832DRAFT_564510 [Gaertneriomyces semiglobifer]|nr:hypothetical protein BC832DRAFT_564510 [Gaertneriomyces semiglobifer]